MRNRHATWPLPIGSTPQLEFASRGGAIALSALPAGEPPHLEARGQAVHDLDVRISESDTLQVSVEGEHEASGRRRVELILHVPEQLPTLVTTETGSIQARSLAQCDLALSTGAGGIFLVDVHGRLRLVAGAGQISGRGVGGRLDVDMNVGAVQLEIEALEPGSHSVRVGAGSIHLALAPELDVRLRMKLGRGSARNQYRAQARGAAIVNLCSDSGAIDVNGATLDGQRDLFA
jgi:hypothetical protein